MKYRELRPERRVPRWQLREHRGSVIPQAAHIWRMGSLRHGMGMVGIAALVAWSMQRRQLYGRHHIHHHPRTATKVGAAGVVMKPSWAQSVQVQRHRAVLMMC